MDVGVIIAALAVVVGGGGVVSWYLLKANKESIVVESSAKAVTIVTAVMDNQATQIQSLEADRKTDRTELESLRKDLARAYQITLECRHRIASLSDAIIALGGDVEPWDADAADHA